MTAKSNSDRGIHCTSENESKEIKVKEEEEDPLLIIAPVMKAENEVSCISVCRYALYQSTGMGGRVTFRLHQSN
jgi:hypothetical protein